MTTPPFNDLRLLPGEEKDPRRLRELFEGMTRNFEDLYNRYSNSTQVIEAITAAIASQHLANGFETLRILRGIVNSTAPTIVGGAGFTLTKLGVGEVKINFSTAFKTAPAVVPAAAAFNLKAFPVTGGTVGSVTVGIVNATPAAADGEFDFFAIGPR